MGDFWKRVLRIEQRADAQQPEELKTYDMDVLASYLTNDELAFVSEVDEVWCRFEQEYESGLRSSNLEANHPWTKNKRMHMLSCASDEELEMLEKAVTILERADKEHTAKDQPGNGNGHASKVHKQKIQGRPWKD